MRYIGSKRTLAAQINGQIQGAMGCQGVVADVFAGTGAVAQACKAAGYQVIAADLLCFPFVLQRAHIQLNNYPGFAGLLDILECPEISQPSLFDVDGESGAYRFVTAYLNSLPGQLGYVWRHYTPEGTAGEATPRMFFTNENGKRIDAVREAIQAWKQAELISEDEYYLLLATVLEAVPRVANVLGTFGAFKKSWEARAEKPYKLEPISLIPSQHENRAYWDDANRLVRDEIDCDALYLDPPYTSRQYANFYHVLEIIAKGDEPTIWGVTGKPELRARQMSRYCTLAGAGEALTELVGSARAHHIFLSYSSDGLLSEETILEILALRGEPSPVVRFPHHRRYRSDSDREGTDEGQLPRAYKPERTVEERLYHVPITKGNI